MQIYMASYYYTCIQNIVLCTRHSATCEVTPPQKANYHRGGTVVMATITALLTTDIFSCSVQSYRDY